MSTKKPAAAPEALATVTYCDKTYRSRSLFLPSGRELKVQRERLVVEADDTEARDYLDGRADFEQLSQAV